jgi:O-antigen/teichoic acid export membrane protein
MATMSFDAVSRICGAASAVVLLRSLPVHEYAYVVVFLAVAQTLSAAATGGIRLRYLRTEAERVSRGAERTAVFVPVAWAGVALLAVFCLIGRIASEVFRVGPSHEARVFFWYCVLIYGSGQALSELLIYHLQAQLAFRRAGLVNLARAVMLLAGSAIIALAGVRSAVAASLIIATALAGFALVATCAMLRTQAIGVTGPRLSLRAVFSDAPWLTVYSFASAAYSNADLLVVAALLSKFDTATFGVATRYYAIALGAVPALIAVFRVRTSQVDIVDSVAEQRRMLRDWMRRVAPIMLVGALVALVCAPFVLPLIDRGRYPQAVPVFQILLLYAVAVYVTLPAPSILMARHRYALLAWIVVGMVVCNVVGDILAASAWGLIGVAICASAVNVSFSAVTIIAALRPGERHPVTEPALVA